MEKQPIEILDQVFVSDIADFDYAYISSWGVLIVSIKGKSFTIEDPERIERSMRILKSKSLLKINSPMDTETDFAYKPVPRFSGFPSVRKAEIDNIPQTINVPPKPWTTEKKWEKDEFSVDKYEYLKSDGFRKSVGNAVKVLSAIAELKNAKRQPEKVESGKMTEEIKFWIGKANITGKKLKC